MNAQITHPFEAAPHRTLLVMALPVLFSMIAEPLTGLVDTAFVASLGAVALAALGVGTAALTSIFWIFNFLGIGGQTEVAQALGRQNRARARQINGLTLVLSGLFGVAIIGVGWAATQPVNALAFATDGIHWGTGDFGFLRNVMLLATASGATGIFLIDPAAANALTWVWLVTGGWILIRAFFGVIRVWPGVGKSPFGKKSAHSPAWLRA